MNTPGHLINDCFLHDKERLRHDEALALLANRLTCVAGTTDVRLNEALGMVLAQTVTAPHPIPMHDNSAVDGYAFAHADMGDSPMPVGQTVAAGDLSPAALTSGSACRIFTGAVMPPGTDTVAMQEDCQTIGAGVQLPTGLKLGANCRKAGEDLQQGDVVVRQGTRLSAPDLAALTSIGSHTITVHSPLRVALFSNGNEMRRPEPGQRPLEAGEVYDANMPMIRALIAPLPIDVTDCGIIEDSAGSARQAIAGAAEQYDIIITTGGASRGNEDHMLTTLDHLGKRHLWQLAVKPGRPMMFGQITRSGKANDCVFFGLPGNPVAAMICFLLYTRPALLRLCGATDTAPKRYQVPAEFEITAKKPDRREFLRGILGSRADGTAVVQKYARDGSGLISSLREADGLIEIPEEVTSVKRGDLVTFIPFDSLTS